MVWHGSDMEASVACNVGILVDTVVQIQCST